LNLTEVFNRGIKLRSEIFWVCLGQLLGFLGSFVSIKALTTIMGPEEYGKLALGLTIAGFLSLYVYAPLGAVVTRFYSVYGERGTLGTFFFLVKQSHVVIGVVLFALALIGGGITLWVAGTEWGLIFLISLLYGIAGGINTSYLALQTMLRQRKVVALHQGADVWLRTGLTILMIHYFSGSGYHALLGYLVGTFVITLSQRHFALRHPGVRQNWNAAAPDHESRKVALSEFWRYAYPFVIFAGFSVICTYSDRWVIQGLFGPKEVGIYAAVYQIASAPVNLYFSIQNQFMLPIIYERAGAMTRASQAVGAFNAVRIMLVASGTAALAMVTVANLCGEQLIRLLTSKDFAGQHNLLWITLLGLSIFNVAQVFSLKGFYYNRPKAYFVPKGLYAVAYLVLAVVFARQYGIIGIPVALCTSAVVYVVAVMYANSRMKMDFSVLNDTAPGVIP
jgi:O-antigen/teichoic acid export membrane protein